MIKMHTNSAWYRPLTWCLVGTIILVSCAVPAAQVQPIPSPASDQLEVVGAGKPETLTTVSPETPTVVQRPEARESDETPRVVKITIPSQAQRSQVTVKVADSTPTPSFTPAASAGLTPTVPADAEPIIFTGIGIDQKCGHGDVVAVDGHALRATPRILSENSNFLELLPKGTRVDIIDCRLWTDQEDLSWLAVRTPEKKLGWMLVQPDKFYVTLYPVPLHPPKALTGVPAGTTIAYVPPSECKSGPVSNEAVATSIGVDFIPVVGDLKGLGEAATGCDLVTGESLGNWRWLGLLGLVGLAEVALLRHGDEVADTARVVDDLEGSLRYSDEVAMAAGRNVDTAADLARGASKLDEAAEIADVAADTARAADKSVGLSDEAIQALAKFEQPCSFSADTLVSTQTGFVPISKIEPGDLVLAYEEALGATGYYTVTATSAHVDSIVLTLNIDSDVLVTTPEHPFYIGGEWVSAGELEVGDVIFSASGETDSIRQTETAQRFQVMYNLTVAKAHTFSVGSGEWPVHNACSRILRRNLEPAAPADFRNGSVEWQAHHVIPQQFEEHVFVKRARNAGWDIDGVKNGIALPVSDEQAKKLCSTKRLCLPTHRGPHGQYSELVRGQLNSLEERAFREGWSDQRAAQELSKLARDLHEHILKQAPGQGLK